MPFPLVGCCRSLSCHLPMPPVSVRAAPGPCASLPNAENMLRSRTQPAPAGYLSASHCTPAPIPRFTAHHFSFGRQAQVPPPPSIGACLRSPRSAWKQALYGPTPMCTCHAVPVSTVRPPGCRPLQVAPDGGASALHSLHSVPFISFLASGFIFDRKGCCQKAATALAEGSFTVLAHMARYSLKKFIKSGKIPSFNGTKALICFVYLQVSKTRKDVVFAFVITALQCISV